MKFYYTGATNFGDIQQEPTKSLGGFMSQSVVPNGAIDKVFGGLSISFIKNNEFQIIGLILKNELDIDLSNVKFWFEKNNELSYFNYEIAFVQVNISGEKKSIEKISSETSLPYIGEFYQANTELEALNIGNIQAGAYIGIWLKRNFDKEMYKLFNSNENIINRFTNKIVDTPNEKVILKVSWGQEDLEI